MENTAWMELTRGLHCDRQSCKHPRQEYLIALFDMGLLLTRGWWTPGGTTTIGVPRIRTYDEQSIVSTPVLLKSMPERFLKLSTISDSLKSNGYALRFKYSWNKEISLFSRHLHECSVLLPILLGSRDIPQRLTVLVVRLTTLGCGQMNSSPIIEPLRSALGGLYISIAYGLTSRRSSRTGIARLSTAFEGRMKQQLISSSLASLAHRSSRSF